MKYALAQIAYKNFKVIEMQVLSVGNKKFAFKLLSSILLLNLEIVNYLVVRQSDMASSVHMQQIACKLYTTRWNMQDFQPQQFKYEISVDWY